MFWRGRFICFAVFIVALGRGSLGCFNVDEYQSKNIETGSSFYQECQCTLPGYTVKNLKWVDNNKNIILGPGTNSNMYTEEQTESISIHIHSISKTMSGLYKCITIYNGVEYVKAYNIEVYDRVFFYNAPENQYLIHSRNSRITCEARGESEPIITWHKGESLVENNEKYEITKEGLIVKNVTLEDAGFYNCTARVIDTAEDVDRYIKVEVMTYPKINEIKAYPEDVVVEGTSLTLDCLAEGTPPPKYIWNKEIQSDKDTNKTVNYYQVQNKIIFDNVTEEDEGTYECHAQNSIGDDRKKITIEVLVPPKIANFTNITIEEGKDVQIMCQTIGRPDPDVTIRFEKEDSLDSEMINVEIIPNLTILKVNTSHEGMYTCEATNIVGNASKSIYLTVLHKPYFEETSELVWGWDGIAVNLTCDYHSNPASNVTWRYQGNDILTDKQVEINEELIQTLSDITDLYLSLDISENTSYGIYECRASNELGEAKKNILLKKAFPPELVGPTSVVTTAATSALFSIETPEKVDGPEVMAYTAEYDIIENYKNTHIHKNRTWTIDRPFKLENLKPNSTYYIKFAARNLVGVGPWDNGFLFNTLDKSAPEPPVWDIDSIDIAPGSNQVLKWKAPVDNGEPIDYYTLRYCPGTEYSETDVSELCKLLRIEPTTELELTGLDYNTTYYLELVAHNSEGNSTAAITRLSIPPLSQELLSAGVIIGLSIIVVLVCLVVLDVLLFVWKRQGIIASCCCKKNKKKIEETLQSRDKKGLLRDNGEADDTLRRPSNSHKEYEYNKTTGIVTGKHTAI